MALYQRGDTGDAVRDIQDRLAAAGFAIGGDTPGEFGEATEAAVRGFQESRRLAADGMVGRETWRILVDASHTLGDRLLYYRMPMLHGDDVAELQSQLSALGFEAGAVDGIFGPVTLQAVLEFQQNRTMAEDGIIGPGVIAELTLMSRETGKMGRHELKERVWLSSLPRSLAGQRVFIDPYCRDDREAIEAWAAAQGAVAILTDAGAHPMLGRSADTRPAERLRADHANEVGAFIVIGFALPSTDVPGVHYYSSARGQSEAGEKIAVAVAGGLGVEAVGRVTPLLRDTRAPAIVVALPRLDVAVGASTARSIESWFGSNRPGR
jgi:N-acetylmuramoyl-L-alanine amidase